MRNRGEGGRGSGSEGVTPPSGELESFVAVSTCVSLRESRWCQRSKAEKPGQDFIAQLTFRAEVNDLDISAKAS